MRFAVCWPNRPRHLFMLASLAAGRDHPGILEFMGTRTGFCRFGIAASPQAVTDTKVYVEIRARGASKASVAERQRPD